MRVKSYREQREAGKKLIQLWVSEDKWELMKRAADSVEEPITTWVRRAIFASLRRWEIPEKDTKLWPKCNVCGKTHDRNDHFKGD